MKNLKPSQIVLFGSLLVLLIILLLHLGLYLLTEITINNLFIAGLLSAFSVYIIFYLLIKTFITERIKILYRSIRKGKFNKDINVRLNLNEDVIENAEIATKNWADEQLNEISKLKEQEIFRREFIGNLAHELKTPIFSIQGYILTLLEGGLEDKSVNRLFLERASKATERMTAMLEDLDQLSKMEVKELQLEISNFDIIELVQDIFEELEIKAKKKSIKLKFAKDYDSIIVNADRSKIVQVLNNLISNSIFYGSEKGETVVRIYRMDDIITIEVSDNGPGIEEQHLARLFERFYRVEKSRNRNEGGSGLGLAIAKKIIEAHGQTINVRSTPGVGSTFTFSLDKGKAKKEAKRN